MRGSPFVERSEFANFHFFSFHLEVDATARTSMISPGMYIVTDASGKTEAVVMEYRARLFQATYVSALYRVPDLGRGTYSMKGKILTWAPHGWQHNLF